MAKASVLAGKMQIQAEAVHVVQRAPVEIKQTVAKTFGQYLRKHPRHRRDR